MQEVYREAETHNMGNWAASRPCADLVQFFRSVVPSRRAAIVPLLWADMGCLSLL